MWKISPAQRSVLQAIKDAKPTAGNDDGWVPCFALFKRRTVRALERMGMLEPMHKGYVGQSSHQYHRITQLGRAAIFRIDGATAAPFQQFERHDTKSENGAK